MNILFSDKYCPKCDLVKQYFEEVKFDYILCEDEAKAIEAGVAQFPCLQMGKKMMYFKDIMKYLKNHYKE